MNYTEKHHLPQWVKSDRIMMEDFNDAMANIEKGMVNIETDLSTSTSNSAQVKVRTWDALLRSGRRTLAGQLPKFSRSSIYCQNGLWFNPLSSAEMADTMSGTQWQEAMGVWAGRGAYLPDDVLRDCCNSCQVGSTGLDHVFDSAASYYEFTSPLTGILKAFNLYFYVYMNSNKPNLVMNLDFKMERVSGSTYTQLTAKKIHLERESTSTYWEEYPVEVNIPIVKGRKYRLTLTPTSSASILGHYGFLKNAESEGTPSGVEYTKFKVLYPAIPSAAHTRSFPTEGPASHGIAVVRYRKEEDASALSISLGGTPMTLVSDQEVNGPDGTAYREAWYTSEGRYQGDAEVKISLESTETDDMRLLEYAVMLL